MYLNINTFLAYKMSKDEKLRILCGDRIQRNGYSPPLPGLELADSNTGQIMRW